MKHMRKVFALALTLIMALALTVPAFAANDTETKTITIANSESGQTYTAYKVFDMTTNANGGYAYTIDGSSTNGMFDIVLAYMGITARDATKTIYENTELTLTKTTEGEKWNVTNKALNAVNFAKFLNAASKDGITAAGHVDATGAGATITVTGAGYYFVDSTLGSLCALDSADTVTIYEKNSKPSITKEVKEGNTWGDKADADFTDVVDFQLTVNTGTENSYMGNTDDKANLGTGVDASYVIVDKLPAGMTYQNDIAVKVGDTTWALSTDYTVNTSVENQITITLLSTGALKDLAQNTDIVITYSASLDKDAVVAETGNKNEVTLTYHGEESKDDATVYTWKLPVFKYTNVTTGEGNDAVTTKQALAGAKFNLKKGDTVLKFTQVTGEETYQYDPAGTVTEITTTATGEFVITGLDSGTYTLTELEAPSGYNVLAAPITVVIDSEGRLNPIDADQDGTIEEGEYATRIEVENSTGTELPSTGGIGTTIFYVVGGLLMAGAIILLITKKKLSNEQ